MLRPNYPILTLLFRVLAMILSLPFNPLSRSTLSGLQKQKMPALVPSVSLGSQIHRNCVLHRIDPKSKCIKRPRADDSI